MDTAGRLKEDHGAFLAGQLLQGAALLARLTRQEALEAEAVRGKTGQGEGGEHRRGTGGHGDGDTRLRCRGDEPVAGVGDGGHPGIRDHEDALAGSGRLDQLAGALALVVLVEGDDAPGYVDAQALSEVEQPTRVLGRDEVGLGESRAQPLRGIRDVADRRGRQRNDAGARGGRCLLRRRRGVGTIRVRGLSHGLSMAGSLDSRRERASSRAPFRPEPFGGRQA